MEHSPCSLQPPADSPFLRPSKSSNQACIGYPRARTSAGQLSDNPLLAALIMIGWAVSYAVVDHGIFGGAR